MLVSLPLRWGLASAGACDTTMCPAAFLQVRRIELSRIGATGAVDPSLLLQLLLECELEGVTRLRCCEGMLPTWDEALFKKLEGLRILNLSSCQLSSLPSGTEHLLIDLSWQPDETN